MAVRKPEKLELEKPLYWVGIGASAGGLEALRALTGDLPKNAQLTYVIAQHLSPKHVSMLPQILERGTPLEVQEVKNNQPPKANVIYITPPNKDVYVQDGKLHLANPSTKSSHPKPSVDRLFTSMAEDLGEEVIGIILSGTGSDGARGIMAIRAAGGITIAQDLKSAKYTGMPGSAIESGAVDLILTPEEIGLKVSDIITKPRDLKAFKKKVAEIDVVDDLLGKIYERSGVNFKDYKSSTILRRIERRMKACSYDTVDSYADFALSNAAEQDLLFNDFLISVTSFLRDQSAFEALEKIVEDIVARRSKSRPIRIWIPGCCTGEEVYTLAMMFANVMSQKSFPTKRELQIFATDISETSLKLARQGHYHESSLEKVPEPFKQRYFSYTGAYYEIAKPLRDLITFSRHNLTEDPPFLNVDLISCRNLLIYFNQNLQAKAMKLFHYALSNKGYLFLGKAENVGPFDDLFRDVEPKERIFQRKSSMRSAPSPVVMYRNYHEPVRRKQTSSEEQEFKKLYDSLISSIAPYSLIVNERLDIKRIFGNIKPFTSFETGDMRMNVSNLIESRFRQEIRSLVYRVIKSEQQERGRVHKIQIDGVDHYCGIYVHPLNLNTNEDKLCLVVFDTTPINQEDNDRGNVLPTGEESRIFELEQELSSTREHLQTVVEELETSNEELQSLNEEMQSSNEELQSTNEELETSNEELQSTNEELTTVNEELHEKTTELQVINDDLDNIMESVETPLLVVNNDLRVTRFNNAALKLFKFSAAAHDEIITNIPTRFSMPNLREIINKVLKTKDMQMTHVESDAFNYALQITPYRNSAKETHGAILIFYDQTEIMRHERALRHALDFQKLIIDSSPDMIFVKDNDLKILEANEAYKKLYDRNELIGKTGHEYFSSEEVDKFIDDDRNALSSGYSEGIETIPFPDGIKRTLHTVKVKFGSDDNPMLLCIARDITQMLRTEEALKSLTYQSEAFIESSGDGYWDWNLETDYEYMSPRFWEIFGYGPNEKPHHASSWKEIIFPEDLSHMLGNFEKHVNSRGEYPFDQQLRFRHKNGSTVTVLCRGRVVEWSDDGKPIRMIGTHTDITEIKRIQNELELANDQLSQFAYRSSHDLRSPIRTTMGMIDVVKRAMRRDDKTKSLEALDHIDTSMKNLDRLILDIIELVKSEMHEPKREIFNVKELVNAILHDLTMDDHYGAIMIKKDIAVKSINFYKFQIHSILDNLISNALKYYDKSKEDPFIDIVVTEQNQNLIIRVIDNGIGIPESQRNNLFKMFTRVHHNRSYGSGLGLFMIKKIVSSLKGNIEYIPLKDGSEFKVTLTL